MNKKISISIVQHAIQEGKIDRNLESIEGILSSSGRLETDLVVFPELFLSGYPYSNFKTCSSPIKDSAEISFLSSIAVRFNAWVSGGSFIEAREDLFYNTMPLINPAGELMDSYRKINLFSPMMEDRYFSPGQRIVTAETGIGCIGLALCYDIRFPELFRIMALQGAQIIIVAAEFPEPRLEHWLTLLRARAIENQVFIVASNRCGKNRLYNFLGHSLIFGPWGETILSTGQDEGLFSAEIDLDQIEQVRSKIPSFKDTDRNLFNPGILDR